MVEVGDLLVILPIYNKFLSYKKMFKQKKTLNSRKKKRNDVKHNKWYSSECKTLKSMLKVAKQNFERNPKGQTLVKKS